MGLFPSTNEKFKWYSRCWWWSWVFHSICLLEDLKLHVGIFYWHSEKLDIFPRSLLFFFTSDCVLCRKKLHLLHSEKFYASIKAYKNMFLDFLKRALFLPLFFNTKIFDISLKIGWMVLYGKKWISRNRKMIFWAGFFHCSSE